MHTHTIQPCPAFQSPSRLSSSAGWISRSPSVEGGVHCCPILYLRVFPTPLPQTIPKDRTAGPRCFDVTIPTGARANTFYPSVAAQTTWALYGKVDASSTIYCTVYLYFISSILRIYEYYNKSIHLHLHTIIIIIT